MSELHNTDTNKGFGKKQRKTKTSDANDSMENLVSAQIKVCDADAQRNADYCKNW